MKTVKGKMDVLCSHTERLGNIERDVTVIATSVRSVESKTKAISSFVSKMNEHVGDIGLVFYDKIQALKTVGTGLSWKELEIRR